MFLKEIHMIYLEKKDFQKSRKDQNQKEVTIDLICQFLCPNSMKVAQWFFHLDEDRFVENAKDLEMKEANFIVVKPVKELEK
jgi:GTP cyclohydrolase FolE2